MRKLRVKELYKQFLKLKVPKKALFRDSDKAIKGNNWRVFKKNQNRDFINRFALKER